MARFNLPPTAMAGAYIDRMAAEHSRKREMLVCSLYALSVSTAPKAVGPQWLEMTPPT